MGSELFCFHGLTSSRGEGLKDVAVFKSKKDGTNTEENQQFETEMLRYTFYLLYVTNGRVK
jgi:hypothetical protein